MLLKNRTDAGQRLAQALIKYEGEDVIIYALPRGGVVLGFEIAKRLNAPLDLIITRKIGYPGNEECALCAVAEDGHMICDSSGMSLIDSQWIQEHAEKEMEEARRRRIAYLKGREPLAVAGKIAIIVDDGVATGLTLMLAIQELKHCNPKRIVVAVPVSSPIAARKIQQEADELVVLDTPANFCAVGVYYESFPQLTDDEVIEIMELAIKQACK